MPPLFVVRVEPRPAIDFPFRAGSSTPALGQILAGNILELNFGRLVARASTRIFWVRTQGQPDSEPHMLLRMILLSLRLRATLNPKRVVFGWPWGGLVRDAVACAMMRSGVKEESIAAPIKAHATTGQHPKP